MATRTAPHADRVESLSATGAAIAADPAVLARIADPAIRVCIWTRPRRELPELPQFAFEAHCVLDHADRAVERLLRSGVRPAARCVRRTWLPADLACLLEHLRAVSGCRTARVSLLHTAEQDCPKFHTDNLSLRMICTWRGPGTEWVPADRVDQAALGGGTAGLSIEAANRAIIGDPATAGIRRLAEGDVALLKGATWPGPLAVHRSPLLNGRQRLLMKADPLD